MKNGCMMHGSRTVQLCEPESIMISQMQLRRQSRARFWGTVGQAMMHVDARPMKSAEILCWESE